MLVQHSYGGDGSLVDVGDETVELVELAVGSFVDAPEKAWWERAHAAARLRRERGRPEAGGDVV